MEGEVCRGYRRGQPKNAFREPPEQGKQANQAHVGSSGNVKEGLAWLQSKLSDYS